MLSVTAGGTAHVGNVHSRVQHLCHLAIFIELHMHYFKCSIVAILHINHCNLRIDLS